MKCRLRTDKFSLGKTTAVKSASSKLPATPAIVTSLQKSSAQNKKLALKLESSSFKQSHRANSHVELSFAVPTKPVSTQVQTLPNSIQMKLETLKEDSDKSFTMTRPPMLSPPRQLSPVIKPSTPEVKEVAKSKEAKTTPQPLRTKPAAKTNLISTEQAECNEKVDDLSVIGEPLNHGTKNVRQILQCVHQGTAEVRDFILNECNIILECRVCRNLFRSLMNFITHKRSYCKEHMCETMVLMDDRYFEYGLDSIMLPSTAGSKMTPSTTPIAPSSTPNVKREDADKPIKVEPKTDTETKSSMEQESLSVEKSKSIEIEPEPSELKPMEELPNLEPIEDSPVTLEESPIEPKSPEESGEQISTQISSTISSTLSKSDLTQVPSTSVSCLSTRNIVEQNENDNDCLKIVNNRHKEKRIHLEQCLKKIIIERRHIQEKMSIELSKIDTNPNALFQRAYKTSLVNGDDSQSAENSGDNNEPSGNSIEDDGPDDAGEGDEILGKRESVDVNSSDLKKVPLKRKRKTRSTPMSCRHCLRRFFSPASYEYHMRTVHAEAALVYPCPFCCTTFRHLVNSTRHMIQIHKKTKEQVESLREVVKRRAYPSSQANQRCDDDEIEMAEEEEDEDAESEDDESEEKEEKIDKLSPVEDKEEKVEPERENVINGDEVKEEEVVKVLKAARLPPRPTRFDRVQTRNLRGNGGNGNVNSVLYGCSNECGRFFIDEMSKLNHARFCPARQRAPKAEKKSSANKTELIGDLVVPEDVKSKINQYGDFKALQCLRCPQMYFNSQSHLVQHIVIHIGREVLKCKGCSFKTLDKKLIDEHLGRVHGIPDMLKNKHMVNLSTPLNNDGGSKRSKKMANKIKSSSNTSTSTKTHDDDVDPTKATNNSGLVLHLRTNISRDRRKKKIYEIVE